VLTEKKYGKAKLCWYMFTTEKCVQDDVPLNYFGEEGGYLFKAWAV
jgi:hypothetical protein